MKISHLVNLILLLGIVCPRINAQSSNPCGVIASISPAVADSVVAPNTSINFSSTSTNATSVQWLLDGYYSGITATSWNYSITTGMHTISLVAYNGNCTDTTTVVYFSGGTPHDIDSVLIAHYGSFNYNEEPTCIDKTQDSGFIAAGVQYPWDACGEIGVLVKLRQKGCVDWSKKFLSPYYCNNSKITSLYASADNSYYVVTANDELAKLDANGNYLWNKRFLLNNQSSVSIQSISGDSQGAIYMLCFPNSFNFFNAWSIAKLDNNGNILWTKIFRLSYEVPSGGQFEYTSPSGMVVLNGKIYVCGNAYSSSNSTYFSFLTKVDATTGAKEWQYGYTDPEFPGAAGFVHLTLYDTLLMASSAAQGQMVTLIDQQGTVRKSIKTQFATSYGPKITKAGADKNGHIYMMQWTEESLPLQPYYWYATNFAEIDTSLNKYWGMVFSEYSRPNFIDATVGRDNSFAAVGTHFGFVTDAIFASRDIRFLRVGKFNALQYCYAVDNSYSIAQKTINRLNFQYLIDSTLSLNETQSTAYTVVDAFFQSRYNCPDFVDSCSFMKLTGPVNGCSLADTYTYRIHRNKKCVLVPQWHLPGGATKVNQTDTTLSIKFTKFGTFALSATLNSCIPVKDSLIIRIVSKSYPLDLGRDTTICTGTTIRLRAAPNFFSYKWSDGSADSVLSVTQPGLYWVEAIDSCSNHVRDSITITPFNLPISVGPDRVKCNNDTLHLNAPGGYLSYLWSNNYNISSTNTQNVIVNPLKDTAYYIKAEKFPGCFAYDTIRIRVNTSPPINIGADQNFCNGDSAVFDAGSGFSSYLWSTGSTAPKITVRIVGTYWVTASTTEGCKSFDTARVVNIFANPVVSLDQNPKLCTGTSRILDAGQFSRYLWNDGSTAEKISVSNTGTYSVHVTDNNGCEGSDTTVIATLLPLPSGFLPADTLICSYDKLTLSSRNSYSSYLWSTGISARSVTITQPGDYWLQVKDDNGCVGRDSIVINPKDCMKGFYIPTAFTPNHDGKNDIFRPLLFGVVKKYQFTIYNRWGQIVFQTKELGTGWDGTVGGILEDPDVFVWTCVYQFEREETKSEKGTVVLIR